jgi:membrane protease YdiL (CAAX protease family)
MELGLGGIAIVLGILLGPNPRERIPATSDFVGIGTGLVLGAIAGILLAYLMTLLQRLPIESIQSFQDRTLPQLLSLLRGLTKPQLVVLSLTAGVGEELLFRGWLMQALTGNMHTSSGYEIAFGIALSSLVFGFAHPMSTLYIVLASMMGGIFGTLYWYFDNLLVPIAAHWIYDAAMMLWLVQSLETSHVRNG